MGGRDSKGRFITGFKHSEESKEKISKAVKGRIVSYKTKLKIGEAHKGMKFSEEALLKMRLAHLGKKASDETKLRMSNSSAKGINHFNWKGGRSNHGDGYIEILQPEHPYCNKKGYVYEHRLVMEQKIGRYLLPEEVVHHENEIKSDNRIKNLRLFASKSEHIKFHKEQAKLLKVG
jgi:hypothetical protein